jgi:16S rRNA G966 N2-methylase RsmD
MFPYRLDVKTYKTKDSINFYDFYKNPSNYLGEKGYKYFQEYIQKKSQNINYNIYHFYTLYMNSVSLFKPLISKYLYQIYKPTCILDPTMGWGGRMLGAIVIPDVKYIGFDTNKDLKEPYKEMIKELKISNRVKLYFKDSAKEDFSKFNYDMVFTSPPYYKNKKLLEVYQDMPDYKDEQDWFNKFFYPVFYNSYKYLKKGGHFCINTNKEGYEMLKSFLGKCDKKIDIKNKVANRRRIDGEFKNVSQEFIYIWKK